MQLTHLGVALLVALAGCVGGLGVSEVGERNDDAPSVDGDLEIHHIDVGQADSTLVIAPSGETMLIDAGDRRDEGKAVIEYLEEQGVEGLDHLVVARPHSDHIESHTAILDHFGDNGDGVDTAHAPGAVHSSEANDQYTDALERHDVALFEIEEGDEIPLTGVEATVLNPPEDGDDHGQDDLHYNSLTLALEFGEFTYLITGDAERDAEARMIDEWGEDLAADVYQAGHHGSSTSSTPPFLDHVDPEIAVISSAYDSQYGHPHDEVLEAFADREVETYWTGVHGDVVVTTDGETVAVETAEDGPTDAGALLEEKPDDDVPALVREPVDVAVTPPA